MVTVKRIFFLLILALLVICPVQSGEKQAIPASNTRTANCLVKITCDPAILPLNLETIDYMLRSSGVGGKARREVLGLSPDQDYNLFTIEYVPSSASNDLGSIGLPPKDSRTGRSSISEEGLDEYEYAMMLEAEMEKAMSDKRMPMTGKTPSTGSSRGNRSSRSTGRVPSIGRTITATSAVPETERTFFFRLNIHLPEDVKPAAKEYMRALVDNLSESLNDAHNAYSHNLKVLLEDAESRSDRVRTRLAEVMKQVKTVEPPPVIEQSTADISVYERLEQIVDLPNLTSSTSFADAIEQLKTAVDPPLQIQPNWKNLLENADIEPTTPANMDPLTGVKLRKALEILLADVSSDLAKLKYVVDDGVILIGTADSLSDKMITRVYNIPVLAYSSGGARELIEAIQNTIEPESWMESGGVGEGMIIPYPSQQPRKLAILQTYENHQKIWKFLQSITMDIPVGAAPDIPERVLLDDRSSLFREKQNFEMELARLQARMPAIEEQIRRIKDEIDEKVQDDQVSKELNKILNLQVMHLGAVQKLAESGRVQETEIADAEEKVARARIELAKRREQIGVSAGTDQLAKLNNELATLAIDMAEKNAMLKVINKQLDQTQQQLTAADVSDPQVSRIRMAAQALELAEHRVNELNARLVDLQIPIVSVLGGD
jgi:hypothetical protein